MVGGSWQERVLNDRLLELGPSYGNQEFRTISYLEFQNSGRVHNVYALTELESKLRKVVGANGCIIYLICGVGPASGPASNLLVAVEDSDGVIYAADPIRIGVDAEIERSRKACNSGVVQKYLGLGLGIIGIPLILAIVGGVMVVVGFHMWRNGERARKAQASKIELLELQKKLVGGLPKVKLL